MNSLLYQPRSVSGKDNNADFCSQHHTTVSFGYSYTPEARGRGNGGNKVDGYQQWKKRHFNILMQYKDQKFNPSFSVIFYGMLLNAVNTQCSYLYIFAP